MGEASDSPSSSVDSSTYLPLPFNPLCSDCQDSPADLGLRLTLPRSYHSSSVSDSVSNCRRYRPADWPPLKPLLRETGDRFRNASLFVKVYMEGVPIGRKLNLGAVDGYDSLVQTICRMFKTVILRPGTLQSRGKLYLLTYQDGEGDWMLVGDIPWEMFLSSVRRLRITETDK